MPSGRETNPNKLKQYSRHPKSAENIIFLPALRLITIMFQRGILDGIDIINDLLTSSISAPRKLSIKAAHLDNPVFLAGNLGGRGYNEDSRPLSTESLSAFFKSRTLTAGYTEITTFYT